MVEQLFLVALGGALGALGRFGIYSLAIRYLPITFPYGPLLANIIGSFAIGMFANLLADRFIYAAEFRLFFIIGLLGAFTTFSSFSLDTIKLIQMGQLGTAGINILSNMLLCFVATFFGLWLAR